MSGPRVDIYVGPTKKHYSLPKNLLCYYSKYFDRCFNGSFIEGQTQKLELLEDKVKDFDLLLEYMLHRGLVTSELEVTSGSFQSPMKHCMDFIKYASKYNMEEVVAVVYEPLKRTLKDENWLNIAITGDQIETVFRLTPAASPLRTLLTQAVLSRVGFKGLLRYTKQIDEVHGFGTALFKVMQKALNKCEWTDPIHGDTEYH